MADNDPRPGDTPGHGHPVEEAMDEAVACDGHDHFEPAVATLVMLDSDSAANCSFACADCLVQTMTAWAWRTDEADDTDGWEVRRV